MAGLLTIAPAALLALGAIFAWRAPSADERLGRLAAPAMAAAAFAAALAGAWVVYTDPTGGATALTLSPWAGAARSAFSGSPVLQLDGLTVISLVLLTSLSLLAAIRGAADDDPAALAVPLAVAAASAILVAGTRSPLGLVAGWIALDVTIGFAAGGGRASLLAGQFGLLLLLAGLSGLPFDAVRIGSESPVPSELRRILLTAACMVRAGVWPIWWAVPRSIGEASWRSLTTRGGPTIAGLTLALMLAELSGLGSGVSIATVAPGLIALAAGAMLAFTAPDRATCIDWRIAALTGLVLVAAGLADPVGQAIGIVLLGHLVLVTAISYGAEGLGRHGLARAARMLGAAGILGLPPTLSFAGRWLLFDQLVVREAAFAVIVVFVSTALIVAPMRPEWVPPPPIRRHAGVFGAAMLVVGILGLLAGSFFSLLGPPLESATGVALPSPLLLMASTSWLRAPAPVIVAVATPIALILGAAPLGWALRRLARTRQSHGALTRAGDVLRRAGPLSYAPRAVVATGEAIHARPGIAGGRRAMAFTFTSAVAIGGAVLSGASTGPAMVGSTEVPLWPVLVATAIIALLLLPRPPAARLAALLATHVLVAVLSIAAGVPPILVVLTASVGVLVVGMIAISVMQAPIDRRLLAAARRLSELRGLDSEIGDRLIPSFAVGVIAIAALGYSGGTLDSLGPEVAMVLRPTAILVAGGILMVIFASTALEVAVGVLVALAGAELVYAALDHGLIVTGALAGFQLLLAVVISFFVGLSPPRSPRGGDALDTAEADDRLDGPDVRPDVRPEVVG